MVQAFDSAAAEAQCSPDKTVFPTSSLTLAPIHRPGATHSDGTYKNERWSWDFVVDGRSLRAEWEDRDLAGVLGWADAYVDRATASKLLVEAPPDYPPNRVAIFVCAECGAPGCGSITAAVTRDHGMVVWDDFRWETDIADEATTSFSVGPFCFSYDAYRQVLRDGQASRPTQGTVK